VNAVEHTELRWSGAPKILAVLGFAMLAIGMGLTLYFDYVADVPLHPVPATGHTVQISVHGDLRYITELDWWLSRGMGQAGICLFFLAAIWQSLRDYP